DLIVTGVQTCALPICLLRLDLRFPSGPQKGVHLSGGAAAKEEELKEIDDRIARLHDQAKGAPDDLRTRYLDKARELEQRRAEVRSEERRVGKGARTRG